MRGGVPTEFWAIRENGVMVRVMVRVIGGGSRLELRNDAFELRVGAPEQAKQTGAHTVVVMVMAMVMVIGGGDPQPAAGAS